MQKTRQKQSTITHWNNYYRTNAHILDKYLPQEFIINTISRMFNGNLKGIKILETGCGKGLDSIALAKMGADVTVVDFSESALEELQRVCSEESITIKIKQDDLRNVEFKDNSFDCIFHSGVLEHFEENDQIYILQNQRHWLKENGFLFVEVPQRYNLYTIYKKTLMFLHRWAPGWEMEYSVKTFKKIIKKSNFHVEKIIGRDFFCLAILRKLKKIFGYKEKPSSAFTHWFWKNFQENPILLNVYVNIAIIAKKNESSFNTHQ